jgi:hypothetical protein
LVRGTRRPTYDVVDVERTLTMPGRNTVPHVDLEDPSEYGAITGRIRK